LAYAVHVEALAQEQLATERALGAFRGDDLQVLIRLPRALGGQGQDVLLHGQVDRRGIDAGQIEVDDELVALAVRVHRHGGLTGSDADAPSSATLAGRLRHHRLRDRRAPVRVVVFGVGSLQGIGGEAQALGRRALLIAGRHDEAAAELLNAQLGADLMERLRDVAQHRPSTTC
jgi:hypothetical protein